MTAVRHAAASDSPLPEALVPDVPTEIEYLTFHAHPGTAFRPLLRELMHAFERPGGSEGIRWVILSPSGEESGEIRESLKLQVPADLVSRTLFTVSPDGFNTWARDLYVFFQTGASGVYKILPLSPHAAPAEKKIVSQIIPSGFISAPALSPPAPFPFAGGDLTSDDAFVYLGEKSVGRMMQAGGLSRAQALERLKQVFKKEIIVLPGADPHQDRYHMPLGLVRGERTSLLADPAAALRMLQTLGPEEKERVILHYLRRFDWQDGAQVRRDLEALFSLDDKERSRYEDSAYARSLKEVEALLKARGVRVVRLPSLDRRLIPDDPLPLGFYYVNLVQDTYRDVDGVRIRRKLVLPKYGIGPMDKRVRDILRELDDFEIRMVDAAREGYRGGGIRCLLQTAGVKLESTQPPEPQK